MPEAPDVRAFLKSHNEEPTPFVWTKTADQIVDNLRRYCEAINGTDA